MKAAQYLAALAAITGTADAAKDSLTHAVLRFTNKSLVKVREDPIANPGTVGKHVHNVMGGSAFGKSVTGEELMNSKCTNAQIVGDMSSYWFPSLYFKDPESTEEAAYAQRGQGQGQRQGRRQGPRPRPGPRPEHRCPHPGGRSG